VIADSHLPGLLENKNSISKKVLLTRHQDAQIVVRPRKLILTLRGKCLRQLVPNAANQLKFHSSQEETNLSIAAIVSELKEEPSFI